MVWLTTSKLEGLENTKELRAGRGGHIWRAYSIWDWGAVATAPSPAPLGGDLGVFFPLREISSSKSKSNILIL